MKQVCKMRKIRKTFVNLSNFCMGRCWIRSWRFQRRSNSLNQRDIPYIHLQVNITVKTSLQNGD